MARIEGPWHNRVAFGPGGMAYRPQDLLVPRDDVGRAQALLGAILSDGAAKKSYPGPRPEMVVGGGYARFLVPDPLLAVVELHRRGVRAQVNHVLFATCCCPPHPAGSVDAELDPDPFYANPFYANPFYANAAMSCCCSSAAANPFYANPFYANPFYANTNPANGPSVQATGRRESSARPAEEPNIQATSSYGNPTPVVAILDTGYAGVSAPSFAPAELAQTSDLVDKPDGDGDGFLDPVAGHGTFIAGIIEQIAPGCAMEIYDLISPYGDVDEVDVGDKLWELADRGNPPDLVNLSFGGYSPVGMDALATAVHELQVKGSVIVASAGNDATCVPAYPAVLPGVVGVAALDKDGNPAPFTNYGHWVRACTLGVDVVSIFFDWNGAHQQVGGVDIDDFTGGWAKWSGTSFAAPRVLAALALEMRRSNSGSQAAVDAIVNGPNLNRKPMLGTVVHP